MKIRFLGTGTSTGVPQIGCKCTTCTSTDSHDKRMRASALVTTDSGQNLLIDCGPDFYHQILRAGSPHLDALLVTHTHYDHVGGIDDLRPYCASIEGGFPVYCRADVNKNLHDRLPYCFAKHLYPGVPTFTIHDIVEGQPFSIGNTEILPVAISHFKLDILGFRIGPLAYVTDCKTMPETTINALRSVDTLVINALRRKSHISHISLDEALNLIQRIEPRQAYLTHLSHDMGTQHDTEQLLPPNVHIAYDGLTVEVTE